MRYIISRFTYLLTNKKLLPIHMTKIVQFDWPAVFWKLHQIELHSIQCKKKRFYSFLTYFLNERMN